MFKSATLVVICLAPGRTLQTPRTGLELPAGFQELEALRPDMQLGVIGTAFCDSLNRLPASH